MTDMHSDEMRLPAEGCGPACREPRVRPDLAQLLLRVDRRVVYALLVLCMAAPIIYTKVTHQPIRLPVHVFDDTRGLYDTIEALPTDAVVLVMCDWGPGSKGENWPQTEAVIHHLLRRGVKFAIMGVDPVGPTLGQEMAERIAARYSREYGRDWVNFGFKPLTDPALLSFADNIPKFCEHQDYAKQKLDSLPVMAQIKSMADVSLVYEVCASPGVLQWVGLIQPKYKTPLAFGGTGVCIPEVYPFLDSGQLCGVVAGMRGAAEYEYLIGAEADATAGMGPLEMGHLLIILLMVIGNLAMAFARRRHHPAPAR